MATAVPGRVACQSSTGAARIRPAVLLPRGGLAETMEVPGRDRPALLGRPQATCGIGNVLQRLRSSQQANALYLPTQMAVADRRTPRTLSTGSRGILRAVHACGWDTRWVTAIQSCNLRAAVLTSLWMNESGHTKLGKERTFRENRGVTSYVCILVVPCS